MSKRAQPVRSPFAFDGPKLRLYNSLTRQKEEFIPKTGKQVKWYSCGPTVYDASHMGHARSYITFDILRRILTNYFGYDVMYVMNVTDIDDKIIKRARQNYLFDKYIKQNHAFEEVLTDVKNVHEMLVDAIKNTQDNDKRLMLSNALNKVLGVEKNIKGKVDQEIGYVSVTLSSIKDSFAEYLDSKHGKSVTDNTIFSELPQFWEADFHDDMDALNILRPNVLTRVSEYILEIIDYIKKIIDNGLAYESNGSVYFDVLEFDKKPHFYAKLVPEAYGDTKSLQEGEGDLSGDVKEKKSPTDFALWKTSKAGEPSWNSPWGKGRPGWHIECSVMASEILGSEMDIHTGGVDLKFPHHDNELAQSEAYYNNDCWVRYFLHSGHLTIAGCKMSKSLKNFVTIKEALKKYTARQLRFAFLLHKWNDTLDYSENTMKMSIAYEKKLNEFLLNVKDLTRDLKQLKNVAVFKKWTNQDMNLNKEFLNKKEVVHEALCDNMDTRTALNAIQECITSYNKYVQDTNSNINLILVNDMAVYVTKLLEIFGISFPLSSCSLPAKETNMEDILLPHLTTLAEFRDVVRQEARMLNASSILQECDRLRDEVLPNLGVRLEDREGRSATIKLDDRETLLREKAEKELTQRRKAEEKAKRLAEQAEKDALKKIPPGEIFKRETDKYSKFDEKGLPTHDAAGKELSKGLIKKLQKLQIQQEKKYTEYSQSLQHR